jgi:hypothetical protein
MGEIDEGIQICNFMTRFPAIKEQIIDEWMKLQHSAADCEALGFTYSKLDHFRAWIDFWKVKKD